MQGSLSRLLYEANRGRFRLFKPSIFHEPPSLFAFISIHAAVSPYTLGRSVSYAEPLIPADQRLISGGSSELSDPYQLGLSEL